MDDMDWLDQFLEESIPIWRRNPVIFFREVLEFEPDDWQEEAAMALAKNPKVAIKSGQGVGKTGFEAAALLWFLTCFPDARVVATAPTRQQLNDVLWSEVAKWQSRSPLLSAILKWTKTYIYMVGYEKRWFAVARTATKAENMQGFHEDNMLFIVDEGSGVADPIMEAILGTLSGDNNKLLICGNPTKASGSFHDAFHASRSLYYCITVSSEDSRRTNKENIQNLIDRFGYDSNVVRVRIRGLFPKQDDDVYMPLELIEASMMWDIESPSNTVALGVDVARFGDDETVIAKNIGNTITIPVTRRGQDLMKTAGDVCAQVRLILKEMPDYKGSVVVNIDDTGLGGGVTDRLNELVRTRELKRAIIVPVNFASAVPDEEAATFYADITTYAWSLIRDMMESKEIALMNDTESVAQLSTRKYHMTSSGKLQLERKKDMKKRLGCSPDRADAIVLSCYKDKKVVNYSAPKANSKLARDSYWKGR